MFHLLVVWIHLPSNAAGLKRMESRGLMSSRQLYMLLGTDLPSNQLFSAPLEWAMLRCNKASDEGVLMADNATKSSILREFMSLRNAFDKIGNTIERQVSQDTSILGM
mmetsp:Transcript_15997/g.26249  ORF Transcript_15997/g.26249 Transcript_15997/m.26249 type:complete len:108 (-) Transcript_15997:444-767(-)